MRTLAKVLTGFLLAVGLAHAENGVRIVDGQGNGVPAVCPSVAQVQVTAAATTVIITGVTGKQTYICGFVLSITTAGTGTITSGTGAGCSTPTVLTPILALGTTLPFAFAPTNGMAAGPAPAGLNVCVTAVTGNVQGMISYVQF